MTAQRAALRRVKAFLATFTAKDDGQRFCATAIDSTFTKPRLVKFTVADLRAVVALAERAAEAERRIAEARAELRLGYEDRARPRLAALLATPRDLSPDDTRALMKALNVAPLPRAGKRRDDDWTDDAVTMGGAYESPKATGRAGAAALARAGKRAKRSRKAGR
jgi:hypothetical protein